MSLPVARIARLSWWQRLRAWWRFGALERTIEGWSKADRPHSTVAVKLAEHDQWIRVCGCACEQCAVPFLMTTPMGFDAVTVYERPPPTLMPGEPERRS